MAAQNQKVIISCAITGAIHTPSMSPYLPITPEQIAALLDRGRRGGRRHHPPARARPADRRADARPRRVHALPAGHQAEHRRGGEHHHRRRAEHDAGRPARRAAAGQARDVQPQHGQHELQHQPRRRPRDRSGSTPGRSPTSRAPTTTSSATPSRTSPASSSGWARAHGTRFEFECYDVGHLYNLATASTGRSSSRRCSCRRSSASSAASAPEPRNLLFMQRDGRPPVRRRLRLVGAGRRAPPDGVHHDGRHHRRQRARRAGGQPVHRPGKLAKSNAEQVAKIRRILEELSLEIATPTEARADAASSRAATASGSDARR